MSESAPIGASENANRRASLDEVIDFINKFGHKAAEKKFGLNQNHIKQLCWIARVLNIRVNNRVSHRCDLRCKRIIESYNSGEKVQVIANENGLKYHSNIYFFLDIHKVKRRTDA